jgi:hypothetical protein
VVPALRETIAANFIERPSLAERCDSRDRTDSMSSSTDDSLDNLLTRSDLAKLEIPPTELCTWIAEGWLEQIGVLPATSPESKDEPVYAIVSRRLRKELATRLTALGKPAAATSPLLARAQLLRLLLARKGIVLPMGTGSSDAPGGKDLLEDLATGLLGADLAQALQDAATDLDVEVDKALAAYATVPDPAQPPADTPPVAAGREGAAQPNNAVVSAEVAGMGEAAEQRQPGPPDLIDISGAEWFDAKALLEEVFDWEFSEGDLEAQELGRTKAPKGPGATAGAPAPADGTAESAGAASMGQEETGGPPRMSPLATDGAAAVADEDAPEEAAAVKNKSNEQITEAELAELVGAMVAGDVVEPAFHERGVRSSDQTAKAVAEQVVPEVTVAVVDAIAAAVESRIADAADEAAPRARLDLSPIAEGLQQLRGAVAALGQRPPATIDLAPLVHAIETGFAASTSGHQQLVHAVQALGGDLRTTVGQAGQTGQPLAQTRATAGEQEPAQRDRVLVPVAASFRPGPLLLVAGLMLCWAAVLYLKTGDARLTLGSCLAANFVGSAFLGFRRL